MEIIAFTKVNLPFGWLGNMSHPLIHEGKQYRPCPSVYGLKTTQKSKKKSGMRIPVKVATQSTGKLPPKPVKVATPSERSDAGGLFLLYLVSCRQICLLFSE